MTLTVERRNGVLIVELPRDLAEAALLHEGDQVELIPQAMSLRRHTPTYVLADLIKGMTPEQCHGEIDWGRDVGEEVWVYEGPRPE